jgi:hypothetical protein
VGRKPHHYSHRRSEMDPKEQKYIVEHQITVRKIEEPRNDVARILVIVIVVIILGYLLSR